jgi:hypothetical protein
MFTARQGAAALLFASAIAITGCGTPGAPLPPSLNLTTPVADLTAARTGNQVTLAWTMPRHTTDRVLLKDDIAASVCWDEGNSHCVPAGQVSFAPGSAASFTAALAAPLTTGSPRPLNYYVELKNRNGKSAGLSNAAILLAGEPPAPVTGLAAEARKQGVLLRWNSAGAQQAVRLKRTLMNPPPPRQNQGPLAPPEEPVTLNLVVEPDGGAAIDREITFGRTYEYRAQRIARIASGGKTIELDGEFSAPIQISAQDVFPPSVPSGLAAVATAATGSMPASIDLSWQPDAEPDVAGYRVYRRDGQSDWRRVSGDQLVAGPAFHDPDVKAGNAYSYAVTAIDTRGNESARSAEAQETVPRPQ